VQLDFIHPGKPVTNTFTESFSGRFRDECVNVHQFALFLDAQVSDTDKADIADLLSIGGDLHNRACL